MNSRKIGDLVEQLCAIEEADFTRANVLAEIGSAVIDPASMAPYLFFSGTHYTRNLIHRCELFEIVALAWEVGQAAPVHNHRGQECWMGITHGRLEVRNFRLIESDTNLRTCKLEPSITYTLDPGNPAAVDPAEPIHSVHNMPEFGQRAVSVHVYSRPLDWCEVYYPDKGRYMEMRLCYTSTNGVLCPGEVATAAG